MFSTLNWKDNKPTSNQLAYIRKIMKDHPEYPRFEGNTSGDASAYIELSKKYNRKEFDYENY